MSINSQFKESRLVAVLVLSIAIAAIFIIPLKVMSHGYLPGDDALRHVGKVFSGKNWSEILVIREGAAMYGHSGWHTLLEFVQKTTGWGPDNLIFFSVVFLFILFCAIPLTALSRPEAWLITLLVIVLTNLTFITRLFFGRPYIFTMAVVLFMGFFWKPFEDRKFPYKTALVLTILIALSTWIHSSWYLFTLPIACFFLAGRWRAGFRIGILTLLGVVIGAILIGEPYPFLKQTICDTLYCLNSGSVRRMLVSELQPFSGNTLMVIVIAGMLVWRGMRGGRNKNESVLRNPVFMLMMLGWVLGFSAHRFWLDWGMPAACIWMAQEFNDALEEKIKAQSVERVLLSLAVAGVLFIAVTNDINSRWTRNLSTEYLSLDNPNQRGWLPNEGGIIYSSDMKIFYDTFYKNPRANWRYILGPEATLMPAEDLAILRNIQWNFGASNAFRAWVRKMKPADRLIVRGGKHDRPDMPELEWYYAATGIWIGRLPRDAKN